MSEIQQWWWCPHLWADWTLWTEYISSHPIWCSFCLKQLAKLFLPICCDLQSHLLSGPRERSSSQRIRVKLWLEQSFEEWFFTHLSQIGEPVAFPACPATTQISMSMSYSAVLEKHCPEIWPKITIELIRAFPRARFSSVFWVSLGSFPTESLVCFPPLRRPGILTSTKQGYDAGQHSRLSILYAVSYLSVHFLPDCYLCSFQGLTIRDANLLAEAQKRHLKDPAQALSISGSTCQTVGSNVTDPSRARRTRLRIPQACHAASNDSILDLMHI